jgi:hypothetical protein
MTPPLRTVQPRRQVQKSSKKSPDRLQLGLKHGTPFRGITRATHLYGGDHGRKTQMRIRNWHEASDISSRSIWLIVALYFVLSLVYVPA